MAEGLRYVDGRPLTRCGLFCYAHSISLSDLDLPFTEKLMNVGSSDILLLLPRRDLIQSPFIWNGLENRIALRLRFGFPVACHGR